MRFGKEYALVVSSILMEMEQQCISLVQEFGTTINPDLRRTKLEIVNVVANMTYMDEYICGELNKNTCRCHICMSFIRKPRKTETKLVNKHCTLHISLHPAIVSRRRT